MEVLRNQLKASPWAGRFEVIGAGASGVSVGDCVEAGKNVGKEWK
jgi:oxygen-dependent protoporphyrinogen oxidase